MEITVTRTRSGSHVVSLDDHTVTLTAGEAEELAIQLSDTIAVEYEIHADDQHASGLVILPAWATGDLKSAVALYFFGYAGATHFVTRAEEV